MGAEELSKHAADQGTIPVIKAVHPEGISAGELWRQLREEDRNYQWGELGIEELRKLQENRQFLRNLLKLS